VRAWQKSGLSQAGYCRQQALQQADFSWWKSQIAQRDERASMSSAEPTFVQVSSQQIVSLFSIRDNVNMGKRSKMDTANVSWSGLSFAVIGR